MTTCSLHLLVDRFPLIPEWKGSADSVIFCGESKTVGAHLRVCQKRAKNAICFDAGSADRIVHRKLDPELLRLPFETCWFELSVPRETGPVRYGFLCGHAPDNPLSVSASTFILSNGNWVWIGVSSLSEEVTEELEYPFPEDLEEEEKTPAGYLCHFLSALNCSNVRRVEHAPPRYLQIGRKREKKIPLFSYWTLELNLEGHTEESEALGGTHTSPRLHLRRGHARQYAPGKWTWVQPHTVGDKSLGMVHKDYKAKP